MAKKSGSLSSIIAKNGVLSKRKLRSESESESESAADDFSDINDAEIHEYLSNKTEMLFKTAMWKLMKKDYNPQKKQRMPATEKKSSSKKAVSGKMEKVTENEETKKRLSSKINYDALKKLTDELEEVTQKSKKGGIDSNSDEQIERQQSKGTSNSKDSGFASEDDNYSGEFKRENANLYSYENEEDDYGYREEYDEHEEF